MASKFIVEILLQAHAEQVIKEINRVRAAARKPLTPPTYSTGGSGGGGGGRRGRPSGPAVDLFGNPFESSSTSQKETKKKVIDPALDQAKRLAYDSQKLGDAYTILAYNMNRNGLGQKLMAGQMDALYGKAKLLLHYSDEMAAAQAAYAYALRVNAAKSNLTATTAESVNPVHVRNLSDLKTTKSGLADKVSRQHLDNVDAALVGMNKEYAENAMYVKRQAAVNQKRLGLMSTGLAFEENITAAKAVDAKNSMALAQLTEIEKKDKLQIAALRTAQKAAVAKAMAAEVAGEGDLKGLTSKQFEAEARVLGLSTLQIKEIEKQLILDRQLSVAKAELLASQNMLREQALQSGKARLAAPVAGALPGANQVNKEAPQTLRQRINFGQGALSTLRYAVPSMALYGGFQALSNSVKTANELQVEFALIESQLASIGESSAFDDMKQSVLDTAKATGQATEDVARLERQLIGAFSALDPKDNPLLSGGGNVSKVVDDQLLAAGKLAEVVGLPLTEITDGLTAAAIAFDASFDEIGDIVVTLENKTGVLGKETVNFLGDIAPVAEEAGYELEGILSLSALVQQRSGRSGTALAEQFGRIIPAVAGAKEELLQLVAQESSLDGLLKPLLEGNIAEVLSQIGTAYNTLGKSSQSQIVSLLGGRREAGALIPALANAEQLGDLVESADNSAGSLNDRFAEVQKTISNTFARLKETFKQIFVDLFNAGIIDGLMMVAKAFGFIGFMLSPLVKLLGAVNDLFGKLPVQILAVVGAFMGLKALITSSTATRFGGWASGMAKNTLAGAKNMVGMGPKPVSVAPGVWKHPDGRATGAAGLPKTGWAAAMPTIGGLALTGAVMGATMIKAKMDEWDQQVDQIKTSISQSSDTGDEIRAKLEKGDYKDMLTEPSFWAKVGAYVTGKDLVDAVEVIKSEAIEKDYAEVLSKVDSILLSDEMTKEVSEALKKEASEYKDLVRGDEGKDLLSAVGNPDVLTGSSENLKERYWQAKAWWETQLADLETNFEGLDAEELMSASGRVLRALQEANPLGALQNLIREEDREDVKEGYIKVLDKLIESLKKSDPITYSKISDLLGVVNTEFKAVTEDQGSLIDQFEAGLISGDEFMSEATTLIARFRGLSQRDPGIKSEAFKMIRELEKMMDDFILRELETQLDIINQRGENDPTGVEQKLALMEDAILSNNLSSSGIRDVTQQYIDLLATQRQLLADLAATEEEAARILAEEIQVPKEITEAATRANLKELGFDASEIIIKSSVLATDITQEWVDTLINVISTSEDGYKFAALAIRGEITKLEKRLQSPRISIGAAAYIDGLITDLEEQLAIIVSQIGLEEEPFGGPRGPAKVPGELPDRKKGDDDDAKKLADEAKAEAEALRKAKVDVQLAQAKGNEVLEARIKLAAAQAELTLAMSDPDQKESDRVAKFAAVINAQRNVEDALFKSAQDYRSAAANIQASIGNNLEAAMEEITIAVEEYKRAIQFYGQGSTQAKVAQAGVAQALIAGRNARQSREQAYVEVILGMNNLFENEEKKVEAELKLAEKHLKEAIGTDDFLSAKAKLLDVQRQAAKVMQDIRISQMELRQTEFEIFENDVASANMAAQIALQQLQDAKSRGVGQAEINNLQASVLQAQKAARDAALNDARSNYDFLYEMDQITKTQYIQYLESLRSALRPGTAAFRELELTIKRLKDDISGDLESNLPTAFNLPTLYETRRLMGTGADALGQGIGYQDNRNIVLNVDVNNGMSEQQVVSVFSDALGLGRNGVDVGAY